MRTPAAASALTSAAVRPVRLKRVVRVVRVVPAVRVVRSVPVVRSVLDMVVPLLVVVRGAGGGRPGRRAGEAGVLAQALTWPAR
ncbi:hypothetical protein ACIA8I_07480 [Streptomyces rishiriensis]|uniref:hypothetical protein n=1 Tax=Streptomyces rishiriensis TaxID=68264 RepID=UPI0037A155D1